MPQPFDPQGLAREADPEVASLLVRCPDLLPLRYRDGEFLIREGEAEEDLFIVLQGSLIVERGSPAANLAILMCSPADPAIVGEMAYFGDRRRTASVRTVGSTLALRLAPRHVDEVVASFPGLTRLLLNQLSRRLKETNEALQTFQDRCHLAPRPVSLAQGETLFSAGDQADALYQLINGSLRSREDGRERELRLEQVPEGFVGLESYLRGRPHRFTAVAAAPCFLMALDASRREDFVRCYPGLALRILEGE